MTKNIRDIIIVITLSAVIAVGIAVGMLSIQIENVEAMQKDTLQLMTERRITEATAEEEAPAEGITASHIGEYIITHYCDCIDCCGKTDGITASGAVATEGITVAAEGFAFGTKLLIDGQIYVVQDRFGKENGNRIDIFVSDHQRAEALGKYTTDVYLVEIK